MRLFGYELAFRKAAIPLAPLSPAGREGWWPIVVREPATGAWQLNQEIRAESVLANPTVYACVSRISQDIGKLALRLVEESAPEIWTPTTNSAYSPLIRNPNHYQLAPKFVEQWITSKLIWGNAYILKARDQRGVVNRLYPLQPAYVTPLIAPDGSVYYRLKRDDIAGVGDIDIPVPASEIIHDRMICLWHPLIGVGPLFASSLAALHGLTIQQSSSKFFAGGSRPGGVLTAPGAIKDETAARLKAYWDENFSGANVGKVAVLGDGLKYEAMAQSAVDSQLVEQLNKSEEEICAVFGVPMFMLNSSKGAPYANNEPVVQLYYAQCLQSLITNFETSWDAGCEYPPHLGVEFDLDDLIWLDNAARTKAASEAIGAGAMTPNEARKKYFGLGPVTGGDTPYMQQQMFSLKALAVRDASDPFAKPEPAPMQLPAADDDLEPEALAAAAPALLRAALRVAA